MQVLTDPHFAPLTPPSQIGKLAFVQSTNANYVSAISTPPPSAILSVRARGAGQVTRCPSALRSLRKQRSTPYIFLLLASLPINNLRHTLLLLSTPRPQRPLTHLTIDTILIHTITPLSHTPLRKPLAILPPLHRLTLRPRPSKGSLLNLCLLRCPRYAHQALCIPRPL